MIEPAFGAWDLQFQGSGITMQSRREGWARVRQLVGIGVFWGLVGGGIAGCGGTSPVGPTPAASPALLTSSQVVIISIDGLRPDAVAAAGAAHIDQLARRGAFTWTAQTIRPSNTLPSHVSMLTGYAPSTHGIVWDEYAPELGRLAVPTLFTAARARGLKSALVAGKSKFQTIRDAGGLDVFAADPVPDDSLAARAIAAAASAQLVFVHLPDVDLTGHATEWMSREYLAAVRRADQAVGRIVSSLAADATVILTADHGGLGGDHVAGTPLDTTIPWIIAGPTVVQGLALATPVRTFDTAATAAHILGLSLGPSIHGRIVREALVR